MPMPRKRTSARPLPELSPQSLFSNKRPAHSWRLDCELITPMYGGGTVTRTVDLGLPFRPTAIRGQLRFWWRLLRRLDAKTSKETPEQRFQAERAIWGGLGDAETLAKSRVLVRLIKMPSLTERNLQPAQEKQVNKAGKLVPRWAAGVNDYALFPAQEQSEDKDDKVPAASVLMPGPTTVLRVTLVGALKGEGKFEEVRTEDRQEIERAIRWWATFGGFGGRTRRGAGAIAAQLDGKHVCVTAEEVAQQGLALHLGPTEDNAEAAWNFALKAMKEYRHGAKIGKSPWPEADSIRDLTNQTGRSSRHPARIAFPRAAFGLPIITHFKDQKLGDPVDTELKPSGDDRERMASPIILRPIALTPGTFRAGLLCLPADHLKSLSLDLRETKGSKKLIGTFGPTEWWPEGEAARRKKANDIGPMQRTNQHDVLAGFVSHFKSAGSRQGTTTVPDARRGGTSNIRGPAQPSALPSKTAPKPEAPEETRECQVLRLSPNGRCLEAKIDTKLTVLAAASDFDALLDRVSEDVRQRIKSGKTSGKWRVTFVNKKLTKVEPIS
ncbi:type III-B CRISPR module RAMP protein Cmr1 [Ahniella affigens]|uniref:Type III-B CRISPR module RAMP protein Cmr1 n=1 Tax=Ahniella affigens TaxID=2021234 RepID=A0A2P1PTQ5_9GAMM|nr:type III-B CRISPR module RAMP protein Cmr1 [Ahniella affigens]AVP98226.1 type III-B CRISPR module RAMP protein Cmr1 [Ahniella affigens]